MGDHTRQRKESPTSAGIETTTSRCDRLLLYRLSDDARREQEVCDYGGISGNVNVVPLALRIQMMDKRINSVPRDVFRRMSLRKNKSVLNNLESFAKPIAGTAMIFTSVKQGDDFITGKLNTSIPSLKMTARQPLLTMSKPPGIIYFSVGQK